jgi:hypothetical protein
MNVRLLSMVGLVAVTGAFVVAGCSSSDDSTSPGGGSGGTSTGGKGGAGGKGGTSATAGTGGAAAGTGGAAAGTGGGAAAGTGGAAAGTGGATAGTGGTTAGSGGLVGLAGDTGMAGAGEAGAPNLPPCGGCAVLSAALDGTDQQVVYSIQFPAAVDLTGATITAHVMLVQRGGGGDFGFWGQSNGAYPANSDYGATQLTALPLNTWTDIVYHPATNGANYTEIAASTRLQLQIGQYGSALAGPTTIWIDSITVALGGAGTAPGPYPFDANISAIDVANAYNPSVPPVAVSATWIP